MKTKMQALPVVMTFGITLTHLGGGIKELFKYQILFEVTFVLFGCVQSLVFAVGFSFFTVAHSIHNFTKITEEEKLPIAYCRYRLSLSSEVPSLRYDPFVHRMQNIFKGMPVIFVILLMVLF